MSRRSKSCGPPRRKKRQVTKGKAPNLRTAHRACIACKTGGHHKRGDCSKGATESKTSEAKHSRGPSKSVSFLPSENQQHEFVSSVLQNTDDAEWDTNDIDPEEAQRQRFRQLRKCTTVVEMPGYVDTMGEQEGAPPLPPYDEDSEPGGLLSLIEMHDADGSSCSDTESAGSEPDSYDELINAHPLRNEIHQVHASFRSRPTTPRAPRAADLADGETETLVYPDHNLNRCLVFSGVSTYSVLHHLGVVLYYIESGLLQYVTDIAAEGLGVPLAVLLKLHWEFLTSPLTSGAYPQSESLRELLWAPVLEWVTHAPRHLEHILQHCFNVTSDKTGEPLQWSYMSDRGPRLHLMTVVPHTDTFNATLRGLPRMFYFTAAHLEVFTIQEAVVLMFQQAREFADNPLANTHTAVGNSRYNTLWTMIVDQLQFMSSPSPSADKHVHLCLSYAGQDMIPPINHKVLCPQGDSQNPATPWEMCYVLERLAREQPEWEVDVTIYSVFSDNSQHIIASKIVSQDNLVPLTAHAPGELKQRVTQHYRSGGQHKVWDAALIGDMTNWGFVVCMSEETLVASLKKQLHTVTLYTNVQEVTRTRLLSIPPQYYARLTRVKAREIRRSKRKPVPLAEVAGRYNRTDKSVLLHRHRQASSMFQLGGGSSYRMPDLDTDTLSVASGMTDAETDGVQEAQRTPCKWILDWWRARRK